MAHIIQSSAKVRFSFFVGTFPTNEPYFSTSLKISVFFKVCYFGQKCKKVHFFQKATFENRYSGYSQYGNSKYDSFCLFVPLFGVTTVYEN